jgi:hypothetical protein
VSDLDQPLRDGCAHFADSADPDLHPASYSIFRIATSLR